MAEEIVRHISNSGSRLIERILKVVMNLRQRKQNVLKSLIALCSGQDCNLLPDLSRCISIDFTPI
jgi:hypothetical protein